MIIQKYLLAFLAAFGLVIPNSLVADHHREVKLTLEALANGHHRSEQNRARNDYRHPAETLAFFGLEKDMTAVEILPAGG